MNFGFKQFMNQAVANAPVGFVPSCDTGGRFEWEFNGISLNGVVRMSDKMMLEIHNFSGVRVGMRWKRTGVRELFRSGFFY